MPWKETTPMSQRHEFVLLAQKEEVDFSLLCRRYGISRKTGYKWLARFRHDRDDGLCDRSRRPYSSPTRTALAIEQKVVDLRSTHPRWGGRKLKARLEALGHEAIPAPSTITSILRRHGCLDTVISKQQKPYLRFEHVAPNDLWQMDFKGDFQLGTSRCHPLTVLDDHSRFSLGLQACQNEQSGTVQQELTSIFKRYGLPWRMTMDNGSPWGNWQNGHSCLTEFGAWLIRLGVRLSHSRPHHPQTQGKDERFHRTLKLELLRDYAWRDHLECQAAFDRWRYTYNFERPHEALELAVPASRYQPSCRPFPAVLTPIEYSEDAVVRRVEPSGQIKFERRHFFVAQGLRGLHVGLRPTPTDGVWRIFFCHQQIMEIDLKEIPLRRR